MITTASIEIEKHTHTESASSLQRNYSPSPFRAFVSSRYSDKHHYHQRTFSKIKLPFTLPLSNGQGAF